MTACAPTRFRLADGYSFTRLINGCWQLASGHSETRADRERLLIGLEKLARAGFTSFDCADIYTGVEELLGELRRRLSPQGLEIEIHTKFVPDRGDLEHVTRRYVEDLVDRSLTRLGVDQIDLIQYHWWDWAIPGWIDTALWLDELRDKGKIGRIGMTNTDVVHLAEILETGVPIVSNQVQYSLLDRRPDNGMVAFCREQGIELLCYGTLAGGFLADRYLETQDPSPSLVSRAASSLPSSPVLSAPGGVAPPRARPASPSSSRLARNAEPSAIQATNLPHGTLANRSLVKYRLIIDELGGWASFQQLLGHVDEIARKHGVSIANVATRWLLDRPAVAGVIVGAGGSHHLDDNLRLFELELDAGDRRAIATALRNRPGPPGDVYSVERQWDGPHAKIMWTDLNRR